MSCGLVGMTEDWMRLIHDLVHVFGVTEMEYERTGRKVKLTLQHRKECSRCRERGEA